MAVETIKLKSEAQREKRAEAIAAMGLVNREGDHFQVAVPTLRGRQMAYEVRRDEQGAIQCSCPEFSMGVADVASFRCEHIMAVKFALVGKNTEEAAKVDLGLAAAKSKTTAKAVPNDKLKTESGKSVHGEQEIEAVLEKSAIRQVEQKKSELARLENTEGESEMKTELIQEETANYTDETTDIVEIQDNVLNFSTTLRELRKNVDPHLIKQREGWRDRNGNVQMVDYVEWHTVADILDETAPNWAHTVKDIRQVGEIMTVTVAITIDGITREGIGTGLAQSEMGIKKAEHDALKRAAVKFGIARDLYRKESDVIERQGSATPSGDDDFPSNPIAGNLSDLVTAKQLGMIRAIAREIGVDPDEECNSVMSCRTDELSKKAASALIQHLQDLQKQSNVPAQVPLRKVS